MPPKKKTALAFANDDHSTTVEDYKSQMLGNMFEAKCSCGWLERYFTKPTAEAGEQKHIADPSPYPSVIFQIKNGK
jgi:hypothetical protein